MEDKRENDVPAESNAAKRIKALGLDREEQETRDGNVVAVSKWENFWYHYKWQTVVALFFVVILIIGVVQFAEKESPDIGILYCGPNYITPNQYEKIKDAFEAIMDDTNGDGRKIIRLNGIVYLTDSQIAAQKEKYEQAGKSFVFDYPKNSDAAKQFSLEVFSDNSIICILASDQYEMVKREGGFVKLTDIFGETPAGAIDEYGVRLSDTKFAKFYAALDVFADDVVIALRTPSLMNGAMDTAKAEKKYADHKELFIRIIQYEYPEGYVPEE